MTWHVTCYSISSQLVGSLLIFVLVTLPAASAKYYVTTTVRLIGLAIVFALFGTWSGLTLAYLTNLPTSFFIAMNLFGSVLGISRQDLWLLLALAVFVIVVLLFNYRALRQLAFDEAGMFLQTRRQKAVRYIFLITIALSDFGLFIGWPALLGMMAATSVSSLAIGALESGYTKRDNVTSAISALAIGLGILFLALGHTSTTAATGSK
ncbi:hypothetical protein GQS40_09930|uniref:Uncharacterized protein n=1 Tax=Leuconostoc lactis TaxID=1246 RepID=A0A6L7A7B0_LEULA|nr:hypothetical protein [Leuconostoc lactis]